MDHDAAHAGADDPSRAGTAEELGFLRAPEPECAGRPDACTCGEHEAAHAHDHAAHEGGHHKGGHDEGGHDEGGHDEGGHDAHAHMRVFPVRQRDDTGRLVLLVDEMGRVTDAGRRRGGAPAEPKKPDGHDHHDHGGHDHGPDAAKTPTRKAPRKPKK